MAKSRLAASCVGRPRSATTAAAAKMVATPSAMESARWTKRRSVRAGQIEPGRVQEMVVVVVDAPEDLVDGGQLSDKLEAPDLVEPEVARCGEQPKHKPGERDRGNGDPHSRQPSRGGELPFRGRQQGIAGHRTGPCISMLRNDAERRALTAQPPVRESSPAVVSKAFAKCGRRAQSTGRSPFAQPSVISAARSAKLCASIASRISCISRW